VISGAVRTLSACLEERRGWERRRKRKRKKKGGVTYDKFVFVLLGDGTPGSNLLIHERVSEPRDIKFVMTGGTKLINIPSS
jgi:hypothetical protein